MNRILPTFAYVSGKRTEASYQRLSYSLLRLRVEDCELGTYKATLGGYIEDHAMDLTYSGGVAKSVALWVSTHREESMEGLTRNKDGKYTAMSLVRAFFMPGAGAVAVMGEYKLLTEDDKRQLGSAVAHSAGISVEECDFTVVEY